MPGIDVFTDSANRFETVASFSLSGVLLGPESLDILNLNFA